MPPSPEYNNPKAASSKIENSDKPEFHFTVQGLAGNLKLKYNKESF